MSYRVILMSLRDNERFAIKREHLRKLEVLFANEELKSADFIEIDTYGFILKPLLEYLCINIVPESVEIGEYLLNVLKQLDKKGVFRVFREDLQQLQERKDKQIRKRRRLARDDELSQASTNESEELYETFENLQIQDYDSSEELGIPECSSSSEAKTKIKQGGNARPALLLLGGLKVNRATKTHYRIIKYTKNTWSDTESWRDSRAYFGLTQIGEYSMYAGGIKDGMCTKDATICKLSAKKYMKTIVTSSMFNARSKFSLVTLGDSVYAVGGEGGNGGPLRSVERWDSIENDWIDVEPMPEAKSGSCAAVLDDKIYVAGVENLISYDPKKNNWKTVAKLPINGTGRSVAAYDGCIYLIGGPTKTFHCYNTRTDSWIECPATPNDATEDLILARVGAYLYVIAGRYKSSKTSEKYINSKKVCRYNFKMVKWEPIPMLPYVIVGANAIVIPPEVYNEN